MVVARRVLAVLALAASNMRLTTFHFVQNGISDNGGVMSSKQFRFPSKIRFTQDSIAGKFKNGRNVLDTFQQLKLGTTRKRDIEMIRVVCFDDALYSLDNRRLAIFKLLEFGGLSRKVKIELLEESPPEEWKRKFTTKTKGDSIEVRGVGKANIIGATLGLTTFQFLQEVSQRIEGTFVGVADVDAETDSGAISNNGDAGPSS